MSIRHTDKCGRIINISKDIANKGDVVLLSPTTSSYDQYKNYEERGKDFKNLVHNL